jgi:type II secretory pathway pseudopilin PulG
MGQQQLLLVILVTIIVGIATVVAINTFGSAADSANLDAVRQDMASIAASAQGYYMKPTGLNGGGQDFTGMTFKDLAFGGDINAADATIATNSNGTYILGDGSDVAISLTAAPSSADGYTEEETGTGEDITGTIKRDNLAFDS